VHQDIKPANILVSENGVPYLLDFGLAQLADAWSGGDDQPIGGTAAYMAPEQARGDAKSTPATDIFALGGVLYFLLTGRAPFHGRDSHEAMQHAGRCDFDRSALRCPSVPRGLADICLRAMAADPAERYATADDFAVALERHVRPANKGGVELGVQTCGLRIALTVGVAAMLFVVGIWYLSYPLGVTEPPLLQPLIATLGRAPALHTPTTPEQLASLLPLRPGETLELSCDIPHGHAAAFFLLDTTGTLRELAPLDVTVAPPFDRVRYPAEGVWKVEDPPGTVLFLVVASRTRPSLDEVRPLIAQERLPAPPENVLLLVNRNGVEAFGDIPRDVVDTPYSRLRYLLRRLRDEAAERFDYVWAAALPVRNQPAAKAEAQPPAPPLANQAGHRRALLVGCTKYDHLPAHSLKGPANDVKLMARVLTERFGFADQDIVTLAEGPNAAGRPTRSNIKYQFDRLAKEAGPGDQTIVLFSGHGSQQPEAVAGSEPDGLDETFLPCDAGAWDGSKQSVKGAIIDDELASWTKAIADRGAALFLVIDSCHSGTMLRDPDAVEFPRELPEDSLVPQDVLERARKAAADRRDRARGGDAKVPAAKPPSTTPRLMALYACQPHEPTIERSMPPDGAGGPRHGLLSYTICQVLTQTRSPLTYRELAERVQAQYVAWGRKGPTPLLDGADQDREVLGTRSWPGRSRFVVGKGADGWIIRAGLLHGLTENSVLAIYPPAGAADADKLLGHARIRKSLPTEAQIEPCPHAKLPAPTILPDGARCEPVHVDLGSMRLRVGIEGSAESDMHRRVREALAEFAKAPDALIEPAAARKPADVRVRLKGDRIYLIGADVAQLTGDLPPGAAYFGPYSLEQRAKIQDDLTKIARACNLLRLAAASSSDPHADIDIEMVKLKDRTDRKGEKLKWGASGLVLQPGDLVGWHLRNRGKTTLDVTLLFIDSRYDRDAVFPLPGQAASGEGRFLPGQTHFVGPARINPKTLGLEHLLLIAVKGEGPPIDFSCLAQRSLERAEAVERGIGRSSLATPLGRLLKSAVYAQGATRGLDLIDADAQVLRLLSWTVAPPAARK
jgi:hypothetical protein